MSDPDQLGDLLEILAEVKDQVTALEDDKRRRDQSEIQELRKLLQPDMDPGESWETCTPEEVGFYASSTFRKIQ